MLVAFIALVAALVSFAATAAMRRYALARSLMDIPNARSSHTVPTPRGGGLAIVAAFLLALLSLAWAELLEWRFIWAMVGAGGLVALVGFLDDHRHIAARWRLLAHFFAAAWALAWISGPPIALVAGWIPSSGWFGGLLAGVYLVWLLNLYNFMDGIDGLASVEAICVCVGGALLYIWIGLPRLAGVPLVLAASVVGFLYWNFPPARIFMGDAGSGFLGIVLGVQSLMAASVAPALLWSWLILLGAFVVDATFTLMRRSLRGEKIYEAHRSHAYQYAARKCGSHLPVTLAVAAINLFWLMPIAVWVGIGGLQFYWGVLLAYSPLVYFALRFKAGQPEPPR